MESLRRIFRRFRNPVDTETINPDVNRFLYFGGPTLSDKVQVCDARHPYLLRVRHQEKLMIPRSQAAAAVVNGRAYIIGGVVDPEKDPWRCPVTRSVEYADLTTGARDKRWHQARAMNKRRSSSAAVAVDGIIYVVGGIDEHGETLRCVECFDQGHGWKELPGMEFKRAHHALVLAEGFIYVVGGHDGENYVEAIERLKLERTEEGLRYGENTQWEIAGRMEKPRKWLAAVYCLNHIYFIGGKISGSTEPERSITTYHLSTTEQTDMREAIPGGRWKCGASVIGTRIYLIGGENWRYQSLPTICLMDAAKEDSFRHCWHTGEKFRDVAVANFL